MKKLLVLALSALMVLGLASISMAATVTVGGELALQITDNNASGVVKNVTTTLKDIDSSNIHVDAVLNDDVSAHIQYDIQNGNDGLTIDDSYIKVANFGVGTLQFGKTGFGSPGFVINLADGKGMDDFGYGINYTIPFGDTMSAELGWATGTLVDADGKSLNALAVDLKYAEDGSGLNLYYQTVDRSWDLIGTLKLDDTFTFKALYGQKNFGYTIPTIGATSLNSTDNLGTQWGVELNYANGPFGAIVEWDSYPSQAVTAASVYGGNHDASALYVRFTYNFANGFGVLGQWDNDQYGNPSREKVVLRTSF